MTQIMISNNNHQLLRVRPFSLVKIPQLLIIIIIIIIIMAEWSADFDDLKIL